MVKVSSIDAVDRLVPPGKLCQLHRPVSLQLQPTDNTISSCACYLQLSTGDAVVLEFNGPA